MITFNDQFDGALRKRIEAEIEQLSSDLANGHAVDFAAYKQKAGEIAGLKLALELCDETHKTLLKN